ncbi:MAG TPA: STAS domain-containing protein [Chloroflexus aurantiacus]|jgi:rsbT co-antagonist protein RsbR|uniref:Sulfate transporter/antisigma-factor antagonist STAS n=1 Tax=Chloroflexus aurantiacus (strain ATCC 29366 / DSM 635 / J-10-fl) TaxID=324602 RepID=A9WA44_CHLAA|nr:STAS domain-containing protein [Chloroflexus aurantiacus]ABY36726.1 Sulfate transporter/antisigma-factor antagonist STAS [Chloroflexus aurantiacus J-10-fl]HBW66380.1 STAS domain-containing protein [Chloroflexus aurantiacus]
MRGLVPWLLHIPNVDEDEQRRGQVIIVLALLINIITILSTPLVFIVTPQSALPLLFINIAGFVIYTAVIVLSRIGQVYWSGALFVITITSLILTIPFGIQTDRITSYTSPFFLIFTLLVAGMVLRPIWVWAVLIFNVSGLLVSWWLAGIPLFSGELEQTLQTAAIFLQIGTALFTFVGGQITATALHEARQRREEARQIAGQLATLNATLEAQVAQRTAALQQALYELEQRAAEQARLLAENEQQRQAIRELSVPVLPIRETTLVMPLVGALDTARLADMQQQALEQIARANARDLFIDVTGVPVIDTQVAKGLIQVVEAARLMGTRVTLVGIRPEVAQTLVTLGIDLHSIRTFSTLQAALRSERQASGQ